MVPYLDGIFRMTYRHHRFPVLWAEEAVGGRGAPTDTGHGERRLEELLCEEGRLWRPRSRTPVPSEAP